MAKITFRAYQTSNPKIQENRSVSSHVSERRNIYNQTEGHIHADFITGSWLDHGELMVDGRTDSSTMADHMMSV